MERRLTVLVATRGQLKLRTMPQICARATLSGRANPCSPRYDFLDNSKAQSVLGDFFPSEVPFGPGKTRKAKSLPKVIITKQTTEGCRNLL